MWGDPPRVAGAWLTYEPVFANSSDSRAAARCRVLGIDPGLTRCGYAIVDGRGPSNAVAVSLGVIRTPASEALPQRLAALRTEFTSLIDEFAPDAVAVEQVFFQVNVRTAMSVGQASGLALAEAALAGCEVVQYTPNQVKRRGRRLGRRRQAAGPEDGASAAEAGDDAQAGRRRRRRGAGALSPGDGADDAPDTVGDGMSLTA